MNVLIYFAGALCVLATCLSLIPMPFWWTRNFDFPRVQIAVLSALTLILMFFLFEGFNIIDYGLWAVLVMVLFYQLGKILPFTKAFPKQVLSCKGQCQNTHIKIACINVLMENTQVERCLEVLLEKNPDVILFLEVNQWWDKALNSLKDKYPFNITYPLDNTYGMSLFSKYQILEHHINFLVDKDVPSFQAKVCLNSRECIHLFCIHPVPPTPAGMTENTSNTSVKRDAELVLAGRKTASFHEPVIVAGDLNDVAWSATTKLFQKVSRLLDPRIGRGFFNTFHANNFLLRFPLDHIFHSTHFKLRQIQRLENVGSDHFPIFVELCLMKDKKHKLPKDLKLSNNDKEKAREKISRANGTD